jgi:hypothetical protein
MASWSSEHRADPSPCSSLGLSQKNSRRTTSRSFPPDAFLQPRFIGRSQKCSGISALHTDSSPNRTFIASDSHDGTRNARPGEQLAGKLLISLKGASSVTLGDTCYVALFQHFVEGDLR